jgi:predicted GH43/DUF377 family glycosyl hydrolase
MLYRAEDFVGKHNGTSRIGLAVSEDGLHFERYPMPVFTRKMMNLNTWNGKVAWKIHEL